MPINRYQRAPKLRLGKFYGTWDACYIISVAVASGKISWKGHVTTEAERLDIIAGDMYGDGTLWWLSQVQAVLGGDYRFRQAFTLRFLQT